MSQQYFAEQPGRGARRPGSRARASLPDLHLELATDSGMFSPSRLDPGTRLLLETAPAPPAAGHLLDLGCGYGPLALVLAARSPAARVWAVDVNTRALELCARNAEPRGPAERALRRAPMTRPCPAAFALIWSNPADPDRQGRAARAARGLAGSPGARRHSAYLVVQRRPRNPTRCSAGCRRAGWPADRVAARSGYRVLRVRRRGRGRPRDRASAR